MTAIHLRIRGLRPVMDLNLRVLERERAVGIGGSEAVVDRAHQLNVRLGHGFTVFGTAARRDGMDGSSVHRLEGAALLS